MNKKVGIVLLGAMLSSLAWAAEAPAVKANEYIIKMKTPEVAGESRAQKASNGRRAAQKGLRLVSTLGKAVRVMNQLPDTGMLHINTSDQNQVNYLKSHPDVEYVEPNYILSNIPTEQGALGVPPQSGDDYTQSYSAVQVTESWAVAKPYNDSTEKTIVAVIDTGVGINHNVFKDSGAIWVNQAEKNGLPGVDDDGNGFVDDINGWNFQAHNSNILDDNEHGTHVAGIVLGVGQDIFETPVRESRITIMPLKFLDYSGSGSTSDAISAIMYAVQNGARVINNSWGGGNYSRALHEAYTYAYNNNVVIVTAAGNSHENIDVIPTYPAALDTPSNITVASTTDSDNLSSFSNYSVNGLVHVAAPGSGILSTVPGTGCMGIGCFRYMSGTSMATPFVSGVAALVVREAPQISAYQVKGIILSSIDYKSSLNNKVQVSGRINALKAVQSAVNGSTSLTYWLPSYDPVYKAEARSIASEDNGGAGGCGMVKVLRQTLGTGGHVSDGLTAVEALNILSILFLMVIPVFFAFKLRVEQPAYVRQHSRYNLAKEMQIKINDQVVDLVSNSVSVGGFSFAKDLSIDKGQKIKVRIQDQEVDAEIVWNRENKVYGVKFSEITEAIKREVESWTAGLVPS